VGRNEEKGWRLDIVSLLAVVGESSVEEHLQALTSSWTCILPRIIPAPQAMLKPSRPTRLPQVNAAVVGVHNGTLIQTLNYFPNILHPIEDLPKLSFKVLQIKHRERPQDEDIAHNEKPKQMSASTSVDLREIESGPRPARLPRQATPLRKLARALSSDPNKPRPRVPSQIYSPMNVLSVGSCLLTIGLFIWAALIHDGTACVALGTISLASSIVGYASWWSPMLMERTSHSKVPPGDVVIRTREGAFLLVKCDEAVARELYVGTEECTYYVSKRPYQFLVALGTLLLMVSVVLLGNCDFPMQAAIGVSYIVLNGAYWAASLVDKGAFWDLSIYEVEDVTPEDAKDAHLEQDNTLAGQPSFTRTMWYAIRETKKIGWVKRGGVAPRTPQWEEWLKLAEENAKNNRDWNAVELREEIVGQMDTIPQAKSADHKDTAEQHAPVFVIPPQAMK